jgi:hypothetical protein
MWVSWTLIGAFGIRSNQANCMLDDLYSKYITFVASMNADVSLVAAQSPIMDSRAAGDVCSFIAVKQP